MTMNEDEEWHPVTEHPPKDTDLLLYDEKFEENYIGRFYIYDSEKGMVYFANETTSLPCDYWRHLPKPPKRKT